MNVRDLTPGTRVAIVHTQTNHVAASGGDYIGTYQGGVMVEIRGFTIDIPWESEFYIADPHTLTAYTHGDAEPDLRGTPPELE